MLEIVKAINEFIWVVIELLAQSNWISSIGLMVTKSQRK